MSTTGNQQIEVIDTGNMQVLSEFAAAGFIHDNTDRFRIGSMDGNIIIAGRGLDGAWTSSVLFERANLPKVVQLLDEVLNGRLRQENRDYVYFTAGKDEIGVGAQQPRDLLTISLYNNRRVKMDGLESGGWRMYVAPDTALKLYVELEKLVAQGIK